jgi:hypothetical protein
VAIGRARGGLATRTIAKGGLSRRSRKTASEARAGVEGDPAIVEKPRDRTQIRPAGLTALSTTAREEMRDSIAEIRAIEPKSGSVGGAAGGADRGPAAAADSVFPRDRTQNAIRRKRIGRQDVIAGLGGVWTRNRTQNEANRRGGRRRSKGVGLAVVRGQTKPIFRRASGGQNSQTRRPLRNMVT